MFHFKPHTLHIAHIAYRIPNTDWVREWKNRGNVRFIRKWMEINQTIWLNISKYNLLGSVYVCGLWILFIHIFNFHHISTNCNWFSLVRDQINCCVRLKKNGIMVKKKKKIYGINAAHYKYGCWWLLNDFESVRVSIVLFTITNDW